VTDPTTTEPPRRFAAQGVFAEPLSRQEALRWLLLAVGGFVAGEILSAGLVSLVAAVNGQSANLTVISHSTSPPGWYVVTSLLGLWGGFLGAALLAIRASGPIRRRLGVAFRPRDLLGILVGIATQIVIGVMYQPFMKHIDHFNAPITKLTGGSHGAGYVLIILMTVIGAPVVEEIFFRGLLLRGLVGVATSFDRVKAQRIGMVVAVLADGLLFGLSHGELVQLPGLMVVGIVLSVLFLKTGKLGMSIVTHASFNGLAMLSYTVSTSTVLLWLH